MFRERNSNSIPLFSTLPRLIKALLNPVVEEIGL